jgi:hypothetical protein
MFDCGKAYRIAVLAEDHILGVLPVAQSSVVQHDDDNRLSNRRGACRSAAACVTSCTGATIGIAACSASASSVAIGPS